jgi:hypothetical protein
MTSELRALSGSNICISFAHGVMPALRYAPSFFAHSGMPFDEVRRLVRKALHQASGHSQTNDSYSCSVFSQELRRARAYLLPLQDGPPPTREPVRVLDEPTTLYCFPDIARLILVSSRGVQGGLEATDGDLLHEALGVVPLDSQSAVKVGSDSDHDSNPLPPAAACITDHSLTPSVCDRRSTTLYHGPPRWTMNRERRTALCITDAKASKTLVVVWFPQYPFDGHNYDAVWHCQGLATRRRTRVVNHPCSWALATILLLRLRCRVGKACRHRRLRSS